MTKPFKLSVAFLLTVCQCVCAQEIRQLSIREMFSIADARNADIGAAGAKIAAARQGEDVVRNALLPQINASLTLSYLGDGTILDRDFGNATRDRLPHFSNTLGVEIYQPVYTGGAISSAIKLAGKETEMAINGKDMSVNSIQMMSMFACMSTIQLNITPTRNYGVFFPVVYILVCGAIQISGLMTAYVSWFFNWRFVYLIIVGLMLVVDGVVYFMMNHDHRCAPFIPLKGVDWTGHLLWVASCCILTWIFNFGEHYDWWESTEIWWATWLFIFVFAVTLAESHFHRNPFISLQAFRYTVTWKVAAALFGIVVLRASAHVLQPILMNRVAGYDYLTIVNFNYPEIYGIVMGAVLTYFALVRWKWRIKIFFFTCFLMTSFYLVAFYFLIDPATEAWQFYLPVFMFGVGEVMMESVAT